MVNTHTFESIFELIAAWIVLAIVAGVGLGSIMHQEDRLFGYVVPRVYHDRLFGFIVPKRFKRA